jgi:tRNA dimethylallyltransferase
MYDRLMHVDPLYALTITPNDRHKIIRALEIIAISGRKVSELATVSPEQMDTYDFRCWFVYIPKEILYPRIEMRCERMIAEGLLEEVKRLEGEGLRRNQTASLAIGYRQCLDFLGSAQSPEDWERCVQTFRQASRRYAKRQFTWFRKEPLFRWLNIGDTSMEEVAEVIIQDLEQSF